LGGGGQWGAQAQQGDEATAQDCFLQIFHVLKRVVRIVLFCFYLFCFCKDTVFWGISQI
jgi:hypothetical protein